MAEKTALLPILGRGPAASIQGTLRQQGWANCSGEK